MSRLQRLWAKISRNEISQIVFGYFSRRRKAVNHKQLRIYDMIMTISINIIKNKFNQNQNNSNLP